MEQISRHENDTVILLIDDDEAHRNIFASRLQVEQYQVLEASCPEEAHLALKNHQVDLVLLDLQLADTNGLDLLNELRIQFTLLQLPIIILTGHTHDSILIKALCSGANDFIVKPTSASAAVARINTHLSIKRLESQIEVHRARMISAARLLALGEFAAGAAHEINNPLAIICGRTDQLKKNIANTEFPNHDEYIRLLETVQSAAARIASIVDAIEKFSRIRDSETVEAVSVADVLADSTLLCNPKLKTGEIALLTSPVDPDLKTLGKRSDLVQIIYDLLSNACDAVIDLSERWVRVETTTSHRTVAITITDSGLRPPDSIAQKLFEPFFSTKPIGRGVGISLCQALGVIKSYGGNIELSKLTPNTCFKITLPRH